MEVGAMTCVKDSRDPTAWVDVEGGWWPVAHSLIAVFYVVPRGELAITLGHPEHVDPTAGTMRFAPERGGVCDGCRAGLTIGANARFGRPVNHPSRIIGWRYV